MTAGDADVEVWGLPVGKTEHHATGASTPPGRGLFDQAVRNDQTGIEALLDAAAGYGVAVLVIDQPGSIAALALSVAPARGVALAYIPGLERHPLPDRRPAATCEIRVSHLQGP